MRVPGAVEWAGSVFWPDTQKMSKPRVLVSLRLARLHTLVVIYYSIVCFSLCWNLTWSLLDFLSTRSITDWLVSIGRSWIVRGGASKGGLPSFLLPLLYRSSHSPAFPVPPFPSLYGPISLSTPRSNRCRSSWHCQLKLELSVCWQI